MIHLKNIDPDNWRLDLDVKEEQKSFVADRVTILARAYAYRKNRSRAYLIYLEDTPIGMAMYHDNPEDKCFVLSQFFIDRHYQGQGYGYESSKKILKMMKDDGRYSKVALCYIEGDDAAKNLYEKLGFHHTGEVYDDEVIMEMIIGE